MAWLCFCKVLPYCNSIVAVQTQYWTRIDPVLDRCRWTILAQYWSMVQNINVPVLASLVGPVFVLKYANIVPILVQFGNVGWISKQKISICVPLYKSNRWTINNLIIGNTPVFTWCKCSSAQVKISLMKSQQGKSNFIQSVNLACIFV